MKTQDEFFRSESSHTSYIMVNMFWDLVLFDLLDNKFPCMFSSSWYINIFYPFINCGLSSIINDDTLFLLFQKLPKPSMEYYNYSKTKKNFFS